MNSSNSTAELRIPLIGDASVVINLMATGYARGIIGLLPHPFFVTSNACSELREGAQKGYGDHAELTRLIADGIVMEVALSDTALPFYEQLVAGSNTQTLDDGEAATIACAWTMSAVALLDERKARKLCASMFPSLSLLSSAELLMHQSILDRFGTERQAELVFNALKVGRMRVLPEHVEKIIGIIGEDRAAECSSLPKGVRKARR
jgi:predicted nucleic acid-binding protein